MEASILISSYNRTNLFKRTLYSINEHHPCMDYEVIVADEGSTEDIHGLLKEFSSCFKWKLVKISQKEIENKSGMKKFHNNPCITNNIAFKHSKGKYVFLMGNEVIAWDNVFNKMIDEVKNNNLSDHYMVMSTTYDVPQSILDVLDDYGTNLSKQMVRFCSQWPLQSKEYHSDVTNYISLCSRKTWETIRGYDERFYGGIACEDSDFVRRARLLPGFQQIRSEALSLHQYHGGKTRYYNCSKISEEKWNEGLAINRPIYHAWNNQVQAGHPWESGSFGVEEVISNYE